MNARRRSLASRAIIALLGLACSDGTGPVTPSVIEIVAGDGQGALPGEMAPGPLRVRVTGSDGQPLEGATVGWAVTSGAATVAPAQNRTDAGGHAETRVTINGTSSVQVRAMAGGLSPVTFSIPVLNPCLITSARPISLELTVPGTLQQLDCRLGDGRFRDLYSFSVSSQQLVTLRVRAPTFDPFATVFARESNGGYFDRGDAVDTVDASRVAAGRWILPAGDYLVSPTSWSGAITGAYELLLSATSAAPEGCEPIWVMRGVTTAQVPATTDCADAGPFRRDVFFLLLWIGERVTLTHSSPDFAPRLRLLRRGGALITEADGSATGTALISFTSDESSFYIVHATSAVADRVGAYTLAVIAP
jgi:Big-like domain-containing protein